MLSNFTSIKFLLVMLLASGTAWAQTPASIYQAATPAANPMNPNGDGWISTTNAGFNAGEEKPMEIPFIAIPQVHSEPSGDPRMGGGCSSTDVVDNPGTGADASYVYYTNYGGQEVMIYRIRLAKDASGAFGFSVLIDSDGKIGNTGANADPNYIGPQGGNKPGNPGFEYEIVYITGGNPSGVIVYNVDGSLAGTQVAAYPLGANAQRSYARFTSAGCTGQAVFYDFYVPISAMGLTSSSMIRLAAATAIQPGSVFGGASDIAGVRESAFPVPDDALMALILMQSPTPISNFDNNGCFITGTSPTPVINGTVFDHARRISGTSTLNGAQVKFFLNETLYATTTVASNAWSFTLPNNYTLRPFDKIAVTVKDPCKYESAAAITFVVDDQDSDNDGIMDSDEGKGFDPGGDINGDRIPNYRDRTFAGYIDNNTDGINDNFDADLDGVPNHFDLDSDNDGISDFTEAGGNIALDANGDGRIDSTTDTDNDGLIDAVDASIGGTALVIVDSDMDGLINALDLDSDRDGISDLLETDGTDANRDARVDSFTDMNGDGYHDALAVNRSAPVNSDIDIYPNYIDIDSDNDGVGDCREAQPTATVRIPSGTDANGNGLDDAYDTARGGVALIPVNTDGADQPDYRDTDTDNDGVIDIIEVNDANRDGVADKAYINADMDRDGLSNNFDNTPYNTPLGTLNALGSTVVRQDTDGDGLPDWRDTNDDNDGLTTLAEDIDRNGSFANDFTQGGRPVPDYLYRADYDGDGVTDRLDLDADNDGIPNVFENGGTAYNPTEDHDADGILNYMDATLPGFVDANLDNINDAFDRDRDGIADFHDLDSDNDGISDLTEAGGIDTNRDGKVDVFVDANTNGITDALETTPLVLSDTDGDGIRNFIDIDADGDGIPDNREAQASTAYVAPLNTDANRNGIDDVYELALIPVNTDSDSQPDYLDVDSDGDSILDRIEGFDFNKDGIADKSATGLDDDKDGLDNAFDAMAIIGSGNAVASNASLQDTDGDRRADWQDTDDDNDGLLTSVEGNNFSQGGRPTPDYLYRGDYDGDGVADRADIDSDNDGIADADENGGTGVDPTADADNDNILNYLDSSLAGFIDSNTDGINDRFDADLDGVPDFHDLDSDNDGIVDLIEAGGSDADGDGKLAGPYASNGLATSLSGTPLSAPDTDGDGRRNFVDLDSDNDAVADLLENRGLDANKNGRVDNFTDTNKNGIADVYDVSAGGRALVLLNTDGDALPNYLDVDSDNDGLKDPAEARGGAASYTDTDNNGVVDSFVDANRNGLVDAVDPEVGNASTALPDTDGDSLSDFIDLDSDADGIADAVEALPLSGSFWWRGINTDGWGYPDYMEADSDRDGISDLIEGNDGNKDGYADRLPVGRDTDGDGWDDAFDSPAGVAPVLPDSDADGRPDYRDNDDDADGIFTIDEPLDVNPKNNVPDYLENNLGSCGARFVSESVSGNAVSVVGFAGFTEFVAARALGSPNNSGAVFNQDGSYLILDLGQVIPEGQTVVLRVSNNWNGFSNLWVSSSLTGATGTWRNTMDILINTPGTYEPKAYVVTQVTGIRYLYIQRVSNKDAWLDAVSYSFVRCNPDTDGDRVMDKRDEDDDNDGIPDLVECKGDEPSGDHDTDGVPNYMDSNYRGTTGRMSGEMAVLAAWVDANGDGINDFYDTDLDGVPNHFDIDSDNDGISDALEANAGRMPANMTREGVYPTQFVTLNDSDGAGTNGNGFVNAVNTAVGGTALPKPDTDLDGLVDFWDIDSDADGKNDYIEGFDDDGNGDALRDYIARAANWELANGSPRLYTTVDTDADGLPNWLEDDDLDGLPNFLDPTTAAYYRDTDRDGLIDLFDIDQRGTPASATDLDGNGVPEYRQMNINITLPVELTSFSATAVAAGAELYWVTASELNNDYFEVERSLDGRTFEAVGRVDGAGTTPQVHNYSFLDRLDNSGAYFYRLKQVDYNGAATTSAVVRIEWGQKYADELNIHPNPLTSASLRFTLKAPFTGALPYKVINMQGVVVSTGVITVTSENAQHSVVLPAHISTGVYVLEVNTPNMKLMKKFIVNK